MRSLSKLSLGSLLMAGTCALAGSCYAQTPAPAPTPANPSTLAQPATGTPTTVHSRVRAFAAGPMGDVQAVFLSDGTVAELPPDMGSAAGTRVRRGEEIQLTGTQFEVAGQKTLLAQSAEIGGQTFTAAQPGAAPGPGAAGPGGPGMAAGGPPPPPPPPPGAGPAGPPPASAAGCPAPPPPTATPNTPAPQGNAAPPVPANGGPAA